MAPLAGDQMLKRSGAIMYDIEIIAAVPENGVVRDPDLVYCGGWEDYEGMGISIITAYDFVDENYSVYLQDNMDDFQTLVNSRNVIIGFNNKRFDDNVCRASNIDIPDVKSFDLWKAITSTQPEGQRRGYSLAEMLKANNLEGKSGLGSDAPRLAQRGLWGRLINYCMGDTKKQVQIIRLAANGLLKNPKNGEYMIVKMPWESMKLDTGGLF